MRRIKLGIIGTGLAARDLHWPPLSRLTDEFEIVALCNRRREKAEAFRELIGGDPRITTDFKELLSWPEIEAVDVATPIVLNEPVTIDALRAGKHVILEKPIGHDLESGRRVVEEAERHPHLVTLVAENVRYDERYLTARRLIDEGKIGRLGMIHVDVIAPPHPDSPYTLTTWRQHPEHIGGYISDGGVHQVAGMQMLAGPVESVQGMTLNMSPEEETADTMLANVRFSSGAVGHMTYAVSVARGEPSPMRVYGTKGTLVIRGDHLLITDAQGDEEKIDLSGAPSAYLREFDDFYRAIAEDKQPDVSPRQALSDLAVIAAAFASSDQGTTVQIRD